MRGKPFEPSVEQILRFCDGDPIERVFLEDVARRDLGRFVAVGTGGALHALCHVGVNAVPSGTGCGAFAREVARAAPRMLIGEQGAVSELWSEVRSRLPRPREDRPGQPVYAIREPPPPGDTGLRPATPDDLDLLIPACAAAHEQEIGVDPLRRDAEGFRWRTRAQIEEGRSWLWTEDGVILFKSEASAWTPRAVQLQQVWVDPVARRRGFGSRGLRDLCRLLLAETPAVCLFVRADNAPAIRLYDAIGMEHVLDYRSVLLQVPLRELLIARHAFAGSNRDVVASSLAPGEGLTPEGVEQARTLGEAVADERIELGVSTGFARTDETLAIALEGREVPRLVVPELGEIRFGEYDGGLLETYRAWAASELPSVAAPGGGESRAEAATRFARGLRVLLERPEGTILAVAHALAVRYVLDAVAGLVPAARMAPVEHAVAHRLRASEAEAAATLLEKWGREPAFRGDPSAEGRARA